MSYEKLGIVFEIKHSSYSECKDILQTFNPSMYIELQKNNMR